MTRCLAFITALFVSQLSIAAPIYFVYTGTGSGSLDGVDFSDTSFTITGSGDTNDIVDIGGGTYYLDHTNTEILLNGIGAHSFTTGLRTFANNGSLAVGLSRAGAAGLDLYNGSDPAFMNWDMTTAIGPISVPNFQFKQWTFSPVLTDGGQLIFQDETVGGTFEATMRSPEPVLPTTPVPTMSVWGILTLIGLLGVFGNRQRSKYC